jgi:hypothetical protein
MSKYSLELKMWRIRTRDNVTRWIAWKLPNRVIMWCYIRVGAYATTGKYGNTEVPKLGMMEAIDRFSKDKKL